MSRNAGTKDASRGRDGCIMPCHYLFTGNLVAGAATILACPSVFPRALIEADSWAHFRILSMKLRMHPPPTAPASYLIAAYLPGVQDTAPTSLANGAELLKSSVLGSRATTPSNWVAPDRAELMGPMPWYKSLQGAATTQEEAPGYISLTGVTTDNYNVEVFVVFEFKGAVASNNTPLLADLRAAARLERLRRERVAEQARLLGSIAGPTRGSVAGVTSAVSAPP